MSNCLYYLKTQTLLKNVNVDILTAEIQTLNLTNTLITISVQPEQFVMIFADDVDNNDVLLIDGIVANHKHLTTKQIVTAKIDSAIKFGMSLVTEFAADNVIMGITQDGMTSTVRKNMEQVFLAVSTGSLYDAIFEIKQIPPEKKDSKYITDSRLLVFINKIETYLNIPQSESLND